MKNYIQKMRSQIGQESFIHPAARIIIENDRQEILFIERADNGALGIPAGSLEEGETIEACIRREVAEETGLTILDLEVIGISSNPDNERVVYPNGDQIQYFTVEFYSNKWTGELKIADTAEVKRAKFMSARFAKEISLNEQSAFASLRFYRKKNKLMLK